jgi:hypothetical protein
MDRGVKQGMRKSAPASSPVLVLVVAIVALLCVLASSARAATNTTGGAIPVRRTIQPGTTTAQDARNPEIVRNEEPNVNCAQEVKGGYAKTGKKSECLPQSAAFLTAKEAAAYLGHYYQNFTPYASQLHNLQKDGKLHGYQNAIRDCVTGGPCDADMQREVMKAIVQYNIGKDIRAQILENKTREENMKSIDPGPAGWRNLDAAPTRILSSNNTLRTTGHLRKKTFRLDPDKLQVFDPSQLSEEQRRALGASFLREHNMFLDAYQKTTSSHSRWHYVAVKSSAVAGFQANYENGLPKQDAYIAAPDARNLDPRLGKTQINQGRLDRDVRSQGTAKVNEIVQSYRKEMQQEKVDRYLPEQGDSEKFKKGSVEAYRVAHKDLGLGIGTDKDQVTGRELSPREVAQAVVVTINKAIHVTEQKHKAQKDEEGRVPSALPDSSKSKATPTTVSVNIKGFDDFLEAIWPADVAKPRE